MAQLGARAAETAIEKLLLCMLLGELWDLVCTLLLFVRRSGAHSLHRCARRTELIAGQARASPCMRCKSAPRRHDRDFLEVAPRLTLADGGTVVRLLNALARAGR